MLSQSSTDSGPGLSLLPFGGLGLDLAEVRCKVSGLLLVLFQRQEAPRQEPRVDTPPVLSGVELLIRLGRETLGS
jgi:hypothetical protein